MKRTFEARGVRNSSTFSDCHSFRRHASVRAMIKRVPKFGILGKTSFQGPFQATNRGNFTAFPTAWKTGCKYVCLRHGYPYWFAFSAAGAAVRRLPYAFPIGDEPSSPDCQQRISGIGTARLSAKWPQYGAGQRDERARRGGGGSEILYSSS